MQSTDNLSRFYLSAAEDAAFSKLLRTNPEAAMTAAGLSEDEKAIARRGDREEIRAALGASGGPPAEGPGSVGEGAGHGRTSQTQSSQVTPGFFPPAIEGQGEGEGHGHTPETGKSGSGSGSGQVTPGFFPPAIEGQGEGEGHGHTPQTQNSGSGSGQVTPGFFPPAPGRDEENAGA